LREGREEAGLDVAQLAPTWWSIADHGDWSYTTFAVGVSCGLADDITGEAGAEGAGGVLVEEPNWETSALAWVPKAEVGRYDLHPGLAAAWPTLEPLIGQRARLIVDAANVVGSRPDGWWRDRAGAAIRLRDRLEPLAAAGLANIWSEAPNGWFPEVTMVVEGQARGIGQGRDVRVVDAPGEGDDQIVATARQAVRTAPGPVLVATADKGLITRIRAVGALPLRGRYLFMLTEPDSES
jgi:hypothetical protein